MFRVLPTATITATMLVTTRIIIIKPCSLLQYKKLTNTKREKAKGREKHHQNLRHQIQGILPPQKIKLKKVNSIKSHMFQIISKSESHKWELPGEMADYVNHQFECFIPEKDVEENLLTLQLVPENVNGVKNLDNFKKSIMWQSAQVLNQDGTTKNSNKKC